MAKNDMDDFDMDMDFDDNFNMDDLSTSNSKNHIVEFAKGLGIGAANKLGEYVPSIKDTAVGGKEVYQAIRDDAILVKQQINKVGTYFKSVTDDTKKIVDDIRKAGSIKEKIDAVNKGWDRTLKNLAYKIDPDAAKEADFSSMMDDNYDMQGSSSGGIKDSGPGRDAYDTASSIPGESSEYSQYQNEYYDEKYEASSKRGNKSGNRPIKKTNVTFIGGMPDEAAHEIMIQSSAKIISSQNKIFKQMTIISTKQHLEKMQILRNLQEIGMKIASFNADILGPQTQANNQILAQLGSANTQYGKSRGYLSSGYGGSLYSKLFSNDPYFKTKEKTTLKDFFTYDGGFDISKLYSHAKSQGKKFASDYGLDMIGDLKEMLPMFLVNNETSMARSIGEFMGRNLMRPFKSAGEKIQEKLKTMIPLTINELYRKMGSSNNDFFRGIYDFLDLEEPVKTKANININNRKVPFDLITRKSIVEVIPRYLAKILQSITGSKSELAFDFEKGRFTDSEKLVERLRKREEEAGYSALDSNVYMLQEEAKKKNFKFDEKTFRNISKALASNTGPNGNYSKRLLKNKKSWYNALKDNIDISPEEAENWRNFIYNLDPKYLLELINGQNNFKPLKASDLGNFGLFTNENGFGSIYTEHQTLKDNEKIIKDLYKDIKNVDNYSEMGQGKFYAPEKAISNLKENINTYEKILEKYDELIDIEKNERKLEALKSKKQKCVEDLSKTRQKLASVTVEKELYFDKMNSLEKANAIAGGKLENIPGLSSLVKGKSKLTNWFKGTWLGTKLFGITGAVQSGIAKGFEGIDKGIDKYSNNGIVDFAEIKKDVKDGKVVKKIQEVFTDAKNIKSKEDFSKVAKKYGNAIKNLSEEQVKTVKSKLNETEYGRKIVTFVESGSKNASDFYKNNFSETIHNQAIKAKATATVINDEARKWMVSKTTDPVHIIDRETGAQLVSNETKQRMEEAAKNPNIGLFGIAKLWLHASIEKFNAMLFGVKNKETGEVVKKGIVGKATDSFKKLTSGIVKFLLGDKDKGTAGIIKTLAAPALRLLEEMRHQIMKQVVNPFKAIGKALFNRVRATAFNVLDIGKRAAAGIGSRIRERIADHRAKHKNGFIDKAFNLASGVTKVGGAILGAPGRGLAKLAMYSNRKLAESGDLNLAAYSRDLNAFNANRDKEEQRYQNNLKKIQAIKMGLSPEQVAMLESSKDEKTGKNLFEKFSDEAKEIRDSRVVNKKERQQIKEESKEARKKLKEAIRTGKINDMSLEEKEQLQIAAAGTPEKRIRLKHQYLNEKLRAEVEKKIEAEQKAKLEREKQNNEYLGNIQKNTAEMSIRMGGKGYTSKENPIKNGTDVNNTSPEKEDTAIKNGTDTATPVGREGTGPIDTVAEQRANKEQTERRNWFKIIKEKVSGIFENTGPKGFLGRLLDKPKKLWDKIAGFFKGIPGFFSNISGWLTKFGPHILKILGIGGPLAAAAATIYKKVKDFNDRKNSAEGTRGAIAGLFFGNESDLNADGTEKTTFDKMASNNQVATNLGVKLSTKLMKKSVEKKLETESVKKAINKAWKKGGTDLIKKYGTKAGFEKAVKKAAVKSVTPAGCLTKVIKAIGDLIKKIFTLPGIKKFIGKANVEAISSGITARLTTNAGKMSAAVAAKNNAKNAIFTGLNATGIGALVTGGIVLGEAVWNFMTGMSKSTTAKIFKIGQSDVTMRMRLTCGLTRAIKSAISNLILNIPVIGIATISSIVVGCLPDDWLVPLVYNNILSSDEAKNKLTAAQANFASVAKSKGLSVAQLNDMVNPSTGETIKRGLTGAERSDQAAADRLGITREEYVALREEAKVDTGASRTFGTRTESIDKLETGNISPEDMTEEERRRYEAQMNNNQQGLLDASRDSLKEEKLTNEQLAELNKNIKEGNELQKAKMEYDLQRDKQQDEKEKQKEEAELKRQEQLDKMNANPMLSGFTNGLNSLNNILGGIDREKGIFNFGDYSLG